MVEKLKSLGFSWFATRNVGLHHSYGKYVGYYGASHHSWGSLGRGQEFLEEGWCKLATKQKFTIGSMYGILKYMYHHLP